MSGGESTVGSIVGFLRLDSTDWNRQIEKAKAEAEALGKVNPDINVNAETADATAKLEGVKAVADTLDAKTADVKVKADGADEAAVKLKKVDDEAKKVGKDTKAAGDEGSGGLMAVLKAIGPILPAVAPLTAGVAGLGLGFAGMGAAGMIAFLGIKKEMSDNTDLGQKYQAGLDLLQGKLQALEHIGATNAVAGFGQAVKGVNAEMPSFASEVSKASTQLGTAFGAGITGTMNLLGKLAPALNDVGTYVDSLAVKFNSWAHSRGASDFVAYLVQEIPVAEQTLSGLATTVSHLIQAFAPFGSAGLGGLNALLRLIGSIPVGALQEVATLGMSIYTAYNTWKGLTWVFDKTAAGLDKVGMSATAAALKSDAASLALGGIGAVLGLAALAWTSYQQGQMQSAQRVQELTDSLDKQTGALTDNTDAAIAKQLQDQGVLDAARSLGLSLQEVTQAAIDPTSAAGQNLADTLSRMETGLTGADNGMTGMGVDAAITQDQINKVRDAVGGTNGELNKAIGVNKNLADATGQTAVANAKAAESSKQNKAEQAKLKKQAQAAAQAFQQEVNAITNLNNLLLASRGDARGYQAAIDQATASLKQNGKTLDITTQAGRDNQQALDAIQQSAAKWAGNILESTHSQEEANGVLAEGKRQYIATAESMGMSASSAKTLADRLFRLPSGVSTKVTVPGTDDAIFKVDKLGQEVVGLVGSKVTVPTSTPNAVNTAMLLNDISRAALSADGKSVNVPTASPTATATRLKLIGISDAAVSADHKSVTIPTAALNTSSTLAAISAVLNAARDKTMTITQVFRQVGYALQADKANHMVSGGIHGNWRTGGPVRADGASVAHFASGGYPVIGPGSGVSDSINALLSNGEYVLTASTVAKMGGFGGVDRLVASLEQKPAGLTRESLVSALSASASGVGAGHISIYGVPTDQAGEVADTLLYALRRTGQGKYQMAGVPA